MDEFNTVKDVWRATATILRECVADLDPLLNDRNLTRKSMALVGSLDNTINELIALVEARTAERDAAVKECELLRQRLRAGEEE